MRLIDQYVSGRYVRVFLATLAALVVVYFLVDMMEKLDPIMENDIAWSKIIRFYAWTIPGAMVQFIFLPCLISCLVVLGSLQKNFELMAICASGVNLYRVLLPIYLTTLVICLITFAVNETIVPRAFSDPDVADTFRKLSRSVESKAVDWNFSYRGKDGKIFRIRTLDANAGEMFDVLYYECRENGTLIYRTQAESAKWSTEQQKWILHEVDEWMFDEMGEPKKHSFYQEKASNISETPQDFLSRHTLPQELSSVRLRKHIDQLEALNFNPMREWIELWNKICLPFWSMPIMALGVPLILKTSRSGMAAGLGACVLITAMWLGISAFGMPTFARGGLLDPFLAAFLPSGVFGFIGCVGLLRIQR